MGNEELSAWVHDDGSGTVVVRVAQKNVAFAFINAGEWVTLQKKNDEIMPSVYADFYISMKDGRAVRVLSRKEALESIQAAFAGGRINWHAPE